MRWSTPVIRAAILLLIVQVVAGCNEPLGTAGGGRLPLVISAAVVGDGASDAYAKTDAVRVRVTDSSQTVVEETTLPFDPSGSRNAVSVEVDGDLVGQRLGVQVELLAANAATFRGEGSATPAIGTPASVEIFLTPIIADVDAPANVGPITAIGGTLQLDAAPVFATGDIVPGAVVSWAPLDPDIVSVSPSGLARALAEGVGRVQAIAGSASAVVRVAVQATVVSVDVEPADAMLSVQSTLEFTAIPRDANQNPLSGRTAIWESSNESVFQVVSTGGTAALATGIASGDAMLTATVDGVEGSTAVTVADIIPAAPSNLAGSASGTTVALDWTDNAGNETHYEVLRTVVGGSGPARETTLGVGAGEVIAVLNPNATSYSDLSDLVDEMLEYTVRACNDAGCSVLSNATTVVTVPTEPGTVELYFVYDLATGAFNYVLGWKDQSVYESGFRVEGMAVGGGWSVIANTAGDPPCPAGFIQPSPVVPGPCHALGSSPNWADYRVAACNAAGCSSPTATLLAPPNDPSNLSGTASGTTVELRWVDNAVDETSYEVLRSVGPESANPGDGSMAMSHEEVIATLPANTTFYQDFTGIQDEMLVYRVRACNGGGCSTPSKPVTAYTVPRKPDNLGVLSRLRPVLVAVIYDYYLVWSDLSQYEDGFAVQGFDPVKGVWNPMGSTAGTEPCPNQTLDIPPPCFYLGTSNPYAEYRVRAYNSAGFSAWEELLLVEPPLAGSAPSLGSAPGGETAQKR